MITWVLCEAAITQLQFSRLPLDPDPQISRTAFRVHRAKSERTGAQLAGGRRKWILNGTKQTAQVTPKRFLAHDAIHLRCRNSYAWNMEARSR